MTLMNVLQIIWRWKVLIIAIVAITLVAIGLWVRFNDPTYAAQVKLQITVPNEEDVVLFEEFRSGNARDEMVIARNNFAEVLESREVFDRTLQQLDSEAATVDYDVSVENVRDSDFMYITVTANNPDLVAMIANTHVDQAMRYYGEVRAKPTTAAKDFLEGEMEKAQQNLVEAEQAFSQFRIENGVAVLERDQTNRQELIRELQSTRDQQVIERPRSRVVERIDESIVTRQEELDQLINLERTYYELQEDVNQKRQALDLLQDKYSEAVLKENTVQTASFIQVVEPALDPSRPNPTNNTLLFVMGFIGSLGFGIVLAFLLDFVLHIKRNWTSLNSDPSSGQTPSSFSGVSFMQQQAPLPADNTSFQSRRYGQATRYEE